MTCEVCLQVAQELEEWPVSKCPEVINTHTREYVHSSLPASLARECITLYVSTSISLGHLMTGVTPERMCKAPEVCDNPKQIQEIGEVLAATLSSGAEGGLLYQVFKNLLSHITNSSCKRL